MTQIIDAHQHFWTLAREDYDWLTPDHGDLYHDFSPSDLLPDLRASKVDGTILVQAAPTKAETTFLLGLAAEHDWVLGVIGWIDLRSAEASSDLLAFSTNPKFRGIRPMLQDATKIEWLVSGPVLELVELLGKHGLVFEALVRHDQIDTVAVLANAVAGTTIILDHFGKPPISDDGPTASWIAAIKRLGALPNVACKMSGLASLAIGLPDLNTLRPFFETVLTAFSAQRVLWGSDWPVVTEKMSYRDWFELSCTILSPLALADRQAIMGGNAARIYQVYVA